MVFLDHDVSLLFEFEKDTENITMVMVLSPTVQSDTEALSVFLFSSIVTIQSANVMSSGQEILAMLQEFGLTDADSLAKGVRGSREVDGILIDLLIDGEVGGVLRLTYPE